MKSMGEIKRRAQEQKDIRCSPRRYNAIQSKVHTNNAKKGKKKHQ